jgi:hypothetical protein
MREGRVRKVAVGVVIGLAVACILIPLAALGINNLGDDRSSYSPIDLATQTQFASEYGQARDTGAEWSKNAQEVALRFVTAGRTECLNPPLESVRTDGDEAVVVIHDNCSFDDSILATKYRLELAQSGEFWEVKWAGWKQKCRRDGSLVFLKSWTAELCP